YTMIQQFRRFFDNGVSTRMNEKVSQYASVNTAGSHLVSTVIRQLVDSREKKYIPRLIVESACKYLGYQLGRRYHRLPRSMCLKISMHTKIWEKLSMSEVRVGNKGISKGL